MDIVTDNLTNEKVSKRFKNQFDLVNYAIRLAAEMIHSGRAPRVRLLTDNPALQVLEEIAEGKDLLQNSQDISHVHETVLEKAQAAPAL